MKPLLAVPSWVIPGTYAENLRFLDSKREIDTVELLFFIYDPEVRSLLDREYDLIRSYGSRFTFTAHLPDPLLPEHEELVDRLEPLVRHFIVHPGKPETMDRTMLLVDSWERKFAVKGDVTPNVNGVPMHASQTENHAMARKDIVKNGTGPQRFLIENTQEGLLEAFLERRPHSNLCMDTGHLLLAGASPLDFFRRYENHIAEVHLHGVDRKAAKVDSLLPDHRGIGGSEGWFLELQGVLKKFPGVINVEVFSWEEAEKTLRSLKG